MWYSVPKALATVGSKGKSTQDWGRRASQDTTPRTHGVLWSERTNFLFEARDSTWLRVSEVHKAEDNLSSSPLTFQVLLFSEFSPGPFLLISFQ